MKSKRRSWLKAGPLAMLLAAGLASPVLGQSVTASVTGVVEDNSGGVLKGATVTAVNQKTNVEYPSKTNDAGIYTITGLPIGTYVVKAEAAGFKGAHTNPVALEVNQVLRVPLKLELGAVTDEIEVVGVTGVLQTENAVVGEVISGSTATALPLNGRNFAQLTLLAPGVSHTDPQSFTAPKNFGGGRPYVNGQREQGNNFMLDGLDQNEAMDNLVAYNPSPDALAEIRIETNNYSAEFGNVAGAVISSVIKSGTNEFHGNAFEFLRNDAFDANSWGNNRSGADKAELKQHIFGATLGGPLVKNKLFFFADYQGTHASQPGGGTASVAPEAWRNGDFSSLLPGTVIKNPATGQPFPGNRIPTSSFSPIARALLNDRANYPLPNANVDGTSGNFAGTQERTTKNNQGDLKLDANLGPSDNAFLRISLGDFDAFDSKRVLPLFVGTTQKGPTRSFGANWTHAFSPATVNEVRLGFTNVKDDESFDDWAGIGNYNATLGIPGGQAIPGLSQLDFSGAGIDKLGAVAANSLTNDKTFQLSDKVSFSTGKHFLSVGGQALMYNMERSYASNSGVLGGFTYSGQFTGNAFSDFLLDQVSSKAIGGASPWTQQQKRLGLFVQDDYKASSKLTVNLGLRWEYTSPLVEKNDRQVNYDLQTGQAIFAGAIPSGACNGYKAGCITGDSRGLYDSFMGGFSPRLGFAWTMNDKTVLRGGYGVVQYMEGAGANNRLPQNTPFTPADATRTYTSAAGATTTGFSDTAAGSIGTVGEGQIRVYQPDLRPQFTQQWNLFVERQLGPATSLSVGYVGNKGTHLLAFRDANQPLPGTGDPSTWVDAEQRRPLKALIPGATAVRMTASDANSNYNGLQASLRRRRSKGLEFLASYTFSKAMQDNTGFYSAGWGATSNYAAHGPGDSHQNNRNPSAEYGPSFFDTKHSFVLSGNYELPIGKGRSVGGDWSGVQQAVLGGWNASAILTAHSGFPVTVTNGWVGRSQQPSFAFERPNRVGDGQISGANWKAGEPILDKNAFTETPLGQFGDSGVGILRGRGYFMLDMGIDKNFDMGHSRALTLRVEAFNVLNHANPDMPVNDFYSADFGKVLSVANAPRILEFALKFHF
jgi:outer membrane receptor protein involved in Fe transport